MSQPGPDEAAILAQFAIEPAALLGAGGESRVFALDEHRVVRIYGGAFTDTESFARLHSLWDGFADVDLGVMTPRVLEVGRIGGQGFTVDRRMPGESLDRWLRRGQPEPLRRRVLSDYLALSTRLARLPIPPGGFRVLAAPERVGPEATLVEVLRSQAELGLSYSDGLLAAAVPQLGERIEELFARLADRRVQPTFVHADYFPGNVMIDGDRISGVIDISVHALAGDPVMNPVAAACFTDLIDYPGAAEDAARLTAQVTEDVGEDGWLVAAYRQWYALYYSMDHTIIDWAARQFRDPASGGDRP